MPSRTSVSLLLALVTGACSGAAPSQSGSVPPSVEEDFSDYESTADLKADPRGIYQLPEDINTEFVFLDPTVGFDRSGKSMRYDYPDRTAEGGSGTSGRCGDYTISRSLRFPKDGSIPEIWIEVIAKTSVGFTTRAPVSWGCTSDEGLKFLNGNVTPGDRFSVGLRSGLNPPNTGQLWFGYPNNVTDPQGKVNFTASANATDGNWHVYRCYWRISSGSPGLASDDGAITCWVDGVMVVDEPNIRTTSTVGDTPPTAFYGLALGRNMNQGPNHPQSIWWGRVRIFETNPRW